MLQMDMIGQQDIEHRPRLAIMLKRGLGGIELYHPLRLTTFENDPYSCHQKTTCRFAVFSPLFHQAEVEVHHGDFDPATKADG
jgi:hypothetical protein